MLEESSSARSPAGLSENEYGLIRFWGSSTVVVSPPIASSRAEKLLTSTSTVDARVQASEICACAMAGLAHVASMEASPRAAARIACLLIAAPDGAGALWNGYPWSQRRHTR